jgi:hypothetical protein
MNIHIVVNKERWKSTFILLLLRMNLLMLFVDNHDENDNADVDDVNNGW